jgi:hypothetical protein
MSSAIARPSPVPPLAYAASAAGTIPPVALRADERASAMTAVLRLGRRPFRGAARPWLNASRRAIAR